MSENVNDNSLVKKSILILGTLFFIMVVLIPFAPNLSNIIIPFGIGIPLLIISFKRWQQFDVTNKWIQTNGKLLYRKVAIDNPNTQAVYDSNGHDLARLYFPYIKYSYEIKGKTHTSENVAFYRELKGNKDDINSLITKLVEPHLIVYYNPLKVEESTLIPKFPLHRKIFWYFIMSIGLTSVIIGLLIGTK